MGGSAKRKKGRGSTSSSSDSEDDPTPPNKQRRSSGRQPKATAEKRLSDQNEKDKLKKRLDRKEKEAKSQASSQRTNKSQSSSSRRESGATSSTDDRASTSDGKRQSSLNAANDNDSEDEDTPVGYTEDQFVGIPIKLRLSLVKASSTAGAPKFIVPFNVKGTIQFDTELTIESSLNAVERQVNMILGMADPKKKIQANSLSNVKFYCRDKAPKNLDVGEAFKTTKNDQVHPIMEDKAWKMAVHQMSFMDFGDVVDDDEDDEDTASLPGALVLDLLCSIVEVSATGSGSGSSSRGKRVEPLDNEMKVALYLLPPAEKEKDDNNIVRYTVADNRDFKHIATLSPVRGVRLSWADVYAETITAAYNDERYNGVIGRNSALMIQTDFSTRSVSMLKTTQEMFVELRKRLNRKKPPEAVEDDKTSFIRVALGKKKQDDTDYNSEDETDLPTGSQDEKALALKSPGDKKKKRNAREEADYQQNEVPRQVDIFMKKLLSMDVDCNPFYLALTSEHWDTLKKYWMSKVKTGDRTGYMFELFELDESNPESFPSFDDLPSVLHPDQLREGGEAYTRFGGKPCHGQYEVGSDGWPRSYGGDPDDSRREGFVTGIKELAKAVSGVHLLPPSISVRVINGESGKTVDLHVNVSTSVTLRSIYDDPKVKQWGVRDWKDATAKLVREGKRQIQVHIWDMKKKTSFFEYHLSELRSTSTERLYRSAPRDTNHQHVRVPIYLKLVCVENKARSGVTRI